MTIQSSSRSPFHSPSRVLGGLLVVAAAFGAGCAKESASPAPPVETSGSPANAAAAPAAVLTPDAAVPPGTPGTPAMPARPGQKEGELCGGIAGLQCAEGLTCKMAGKPHPDQAGACAKP